MHLERSLRRLRLDPSTTVQGSSPGEVSGTRPSAAGQLGGGGGVLVFCDPRTWPKDPEKLKLPEGWVAPVGAHPKYAVTSVIAILIACPG
jgi:hypothetical protein